MQNTLALADAQGQLSRETGVSVEAIQEWGYIASVNGSSAEAFQTSLSGLSKKIGETATKGSEEFTRLGISVRDSFGNVKGADTILAEVSQKFKQLNLSKEQQSDFLEKLGIDKSMIQTMNLSSDALASLRGEAQALGVVSQEETDKIIAYNDSMTTLRYGVDSLQKKLAIAMIPQIQALSDAFIQLLKDNKGLISEGLEKFTSVMGIAFKAVFRFGKIIVDLFSNMTSGQKALVGVTAGIYLLNKAINMSPIAKVTTGILALFVAIDDLNIGLQGGQSVIADWFKSWSGIDILPIVGAGIEELGNMFTWLGNTISNVWDFISPILKLIFDSIGGAIKMVSNLGDVASSVGDFFGFGGDEKQLNQDSMNLNQDSKQLNQNPMNLNQDSMLSKPITNNSNSTNVQQTNNMTFNVKSTDPVKVGEEIQKQMKNANTQFSVGGR